MFRYTARQLKAVKAHLKRGGVIAYPTEACYGFGCDPFNYKAIATIIRIKGRSKAKGLIVIAGTENQLEGLIKPLPAIDKQQIQQYWPGPFSIILPVTNKVPRNLIGSHEQIAVRVTKHELVRQLCSNLHMPLVSTSANKSGHRPATTHRECARLFGHKIMVLAGNTNFAKKPSTIIDWKTRRVLR